MNKIDVLNTNDSGIEFDKEGNVIPSPEGNIGYISMPGAFANDSYANGWDYNGTLENEYEEKFSLFFQVGYNPESLDTQVLGFSFKQGDYRYYLTNVYGGESGDARLESFFQMLTNISSSTSLESAEIVGTPFVSEDNKDRKNALEISACMPNPKKKYKKIYQGYVGQPGCVYKVKSTVNAFLWQYDNDGNSSVQKCSYDFSMTLIDTRGVVGEGLANGYTGRLGTTKKGEPDSSAEIGQVGLKVTGWSMSIDNFSDNPGYQTNYYFSGNKGMFWMDGGGQLNRSITTHIPESFGENVNQLFNNKSSDEQKEILATLVGKPNEFSPLGKPIYVGNWMPVQFTKGIYAGTSLSFWALWFKSTERPNGTQTTDDFDWCKSGSSNMYTGIIEDDITSAYSALQNLLPQCPDHLSKAPSSTSWTNPFEIRILNYVDKKYDPTFPWAREVEITIRAYSRMRSVLADYANRRNSGDLNNIVDRNDTDLVLILRTISPVNQISIVSQSWVAPFYESAASLEIVHDRELPYEDVGYAWIEHMGAPRAANK